MKIEIAKEDIFAVAIAIRTATINYPDMPDSDRESLCRVFETIRVEIRGEFNIMELVEKNSQYA